MVVSDPKVFRLSTQQERLWALLKVSQAFRVQCAVMIEGKLNTALFFSVFQSLIDQHDILRTAFYHWPDMEIPLQVVTHQVRLSCPVVDMRDLSGSQQTTLLDKYFSAFLSEDLDLEYDTLLNTILVHLSAEKYMLFICLPALCADGPTLERIVQSLLQAYASCLTGENRAEEPLQYVDVSAWQNELLTAEDAEAQIRYWHGVDLARLHNIYLPFERKYTSVGRNLHKSQDRAFTPGILDIDVEANLANQLQALAQQFRVSVSHVLLACWQVLLWHLDETGGIVGVTCDGRNYEELSDGIGPYARIVPMSVTLDGSLSFEQVVHMIDDTWREVIKRQEYFTWELVGNDARDDQHTFPFCPISFEYDTWPASSTSGMLTSSLWRRYCCIDLFTLKLLVLQIKDKLQFSLHYDAQIFSCERAERLSCLLKQLFESVVNTPQVTMNSLPILPVYMQERLLQISRAPAALHPAQGLHQLFEAQVAHASDSIAVVSRDEQLTYEALNDLANQLARLLLRQGIGPGAMVGLYVHRSVSMIIGMLAILKAGGAYVPLDPEIPPTRLAYQLQTAQAQVLLSQQTLLPRVEDWNGKILCLETSTQEMHQELRSNLPSRNEPGDIAYVIYTSGSTGKPKGVAIQHRSVTNYTLSLCHLMKWEPGLQFATVSTLAADLGNTAIFCSLALGGCLQVLDYETITSADAFAIWAAQRPIDVLKIVPSHLSALLANNARFVLPSRALILGGEVFPVNLLRQLREYGCSCTIVNHYGPTEATIGILVNILGQLDTLEENNILGAEYTPVPLGLPIANSEAYILDHKLQLVPFEVVGELYLAGAGLSIGYIHQPEQTAERFIPHPFCTEHGARLYRTGDLARYTREGQIEFIKRRDDQIKLRGYRIELGEIDTILRTHMNVWDAVTVLREDIVGEPCIVSYIAKRQKTELTNKMLRDFVHEQLPGYMVPSAFVILDTLPLTRNGKVNRLLLPLPEQSKGETTLEQVLPRSPIEEMLGDIWKDILGVTSIGIHDDFFRLGGHSLLATQLIARVRSVTQTDVSILRLFKAPTIAGLAMCIEQALRGEQELDIPSLAPMPRTLALPLSFAQQRLWLLHQLDPESTAYLLPMAQWIEGSLSVVALERSLQALIERHEILRTTFPLQNGGAVQFIHPSSVFCLPLIDLHALDEATRNHEVWQLCNQDARVPFDLSCEPLLRAYLLRVNDQRHVLSLTMHHIISDGWSNPILHREMMILYSAFAAGESSPLEPLPVQYADFALWQRQWLQGAVLDRQLAYWRSQLEGVQALELPADRPRPPIKTYSGALQTLLLPASLCDDLRAMSQREHVTLFMLLLAVFQVLMARYSRQQDIAVGTPIANRTHREVEGLIGFFVNTLVLRSQVQGTQSFRQFLEQVREMALGAYAYQDVPFEQLVEMLQPERDLSRSPLFQVMFGFQEVSPLSLPAVSLPTVDLQVHPLSVEHLTTKFDLSLLVISGPTSFSCGVEYNTDLFEAATIQRLLGHWQVLLEAVVVDAHQPVAHLPLLTAAEARRILDEWNNTNGPEPAFDSLPQALEAQVGRTPDALALVFEDTCLSYQALFERARGLAWRLYQAGVGPEVLVGVCLERSLELIIGELAIILAGGAYVPLDPASPPERLSFLLQDAGISILFTREQLLAKVSVPGVQTICLDRGSELFAWKRTEPLTPSVTAQNLAYMIYTSGSTGTPKGVQIQYGGLLNLIVWHQRAFAVSPGDRATLIAAPAFDASVWELWPYLVAGASLAIPTENVRLSPLLLRDWLVSRAITICFLPTPLAEQVLSLAWSDARVLRILLTGGDRLHIHPPSLPFELINNYGPTENTVVATSGLVLSEEHAERPPSLGRPIARNQAYVLDTFLNPVPVGVVGELYLGGASLARGYWRAADLTSASFIPHPWGAKGERLYRTGDLVRYLLDGNLEFFGRRDAQIKLRGYRIELGEIEEVLLGYAGVQSSAVKVWEQAGGERRLQGYVVLREAEELRREELLSYLRERLPDYMIPWRIEQLERMPLSLNGKVDYARLEPGAEEQGREAVGEWTQMEELVGQVWSEVLGKKQLDQQANFFEVGGHSLLATQVVARLRTLLAIELPIRTILETPVLQAFARRVEQELQGKQGLEVPPLLPMVRGEQPVPLSFAQQRLWFLDQLEPGNTAYLIPRRYHLQGVLVPQTLERSLQELVRRHEVLRTTFQVRTDQTVQVIHPAKQFLLPYIDISHLPEEEWRSEAHRLAQHEALRPCDLQQGPLLRVWLLRLAPEEHLLLITMHHIISDAWSNDVFYRELTALYNAFVAGRPSPLEPLPIQYADFAFWQRQWLQGEILETILAFWMRQLKGGTPLRFPTDYPRPDVPSYRGDEYAFLLPLDLFQSITLLNHHEGCTLFMLLLAAFQTLLYRYTDQTDIIVGTDIANRTRVETQFLIGFFVNLLVLRNDLGGAPTFRELLHRTKEMVLDAYTYQDAPFEMLVEKLLPDHSLDRMPLVQVLFVLQNQPASQVQQIPGIVTKPFINTGAPTAKFDLAVFMQEGPDGLHGVVRYSSDLFKRSSIATLINRFEVLLRDVVTHPDASIDRVNFYTDAERIKQAQKEEASLRKLRFQRSDAIHLPEV